MRSFADNSTLPSSPASVPPPTFADCLFTGLGYYWLTTTIVVLGVLFGHEFVAPPRNAPGKPSGVLDSFASWDGQWFRRIAVEGYDFDPNRQSSVAFFPAYPMITRLISRCTGCSVELALVHFSHVCLAGTFVLLVLYVRQRYPTAPAELADQVLLALGLLPTTAFFRFAYSESLFILISLLALYGMQRRWPLMAIALTIGLATATRAVGVALLLSFVLHVRQRTPSIRLWLAHSAIWLPLACWGIVGYMIYQRNAFGTPIAFVYAHECWHVRPLLPLGEKLLPLLAAEPIWSVFDPSSPAYWARFTQETSFLFNLDFANPLYFIGTSVLLLLGAWYRWLNSSELSLSLLLLLIPYLTRSYEMGMQGMGRFTAAVLPVYLVLGHLLQRLPPPLAALLLSLCGFMLGVYSAMFASGHRIL